MDACRVTVQLQRFAGQQPQSVALRLPTDACVHEAAVEAARVCGMPVDTLSFAARMNGAPVPASTTVTPGAAYEVAVEASRRRGHGAAASTAPGASPFPQTVSRYDDDDEYSLAAGGGDDARGRLVAARYGTGASPSRMAVSPRRAVWAQEAFQPPPDPDTAVHCAGRGCSRSPVRDHHEYGGDGADTVEQQDASPCRSFAPKWGADHICADCGESPQRHYVRMLQARFGS